MPRVIDFVQDASNVWLPCSVNHMGVGQLDSLRSCRFVNGVGHLENDLRIIQNGSGDYKRLDNYK